MPDKFLELALSSNLKNIENYVKSDEFIKEKKTKSFNEQILFAIRSAIHHEEYELLLLYDKLFNLDNPNDKKTIWIAAQHSFKIFNIFANKKKVMSQIFNPNEHPLVAAFAKNNFEVAKWLKNWCDKNKTPVKVKALATLEAAKRGNIEVLRLYQISDSQLCKIIRALIDNGHSNKVKHLTFLKDKNDNFINDFSYNNFEMLDTCAGHFDSLSYLIRHPSIQTKLNNLSTNYKNLNSILESRFNEHKDLYTKQHKDIAKREADKLISKGIDPNIACIASLIVNKKKFLNDLKTNDVYSYRLT